REAKSRNAEQYAHYNKLIRRKCKTEKETWLANLCREIELLQAQHKDKLLHARIRQMTGRRRPASGCIQTTDLDERCQVWADYIKTLYSDDTLQDQDENEKEPSRNDNDSILQE